MSGFQNQKESVGAFRSRLTPHIRLITKLYFHDKLSSRKIAEILKEKTGLSVSHQAVLDFIRVRQNRKNMHKMSVNYLQFLNETAIEVPIPSAKRKPRKNAVSENDKDRDEKQKALDKLAALEALSPMDFYQVVLDDKKREKSKSGSK